MNIVTGYKGEAHITAQEVRGENMGIFGQDSYVLDVGLQFMLEDSGGGTLTMYNGVLCHQGTIAEIPYGTQESIEIANGTVGLIRCDAVVARYSRNTEGVESMTIEVIQGTPNASIAEPPEITEGVVADGATVSDMLLYYVYLDGTNIDTIDAQFVTVPSLTSLQEYIDTQIESAIDDVTKVETISQSNYITASSGVTIDSFSCRRSGNIIAVYFRARPSAAKTGSWTIGTVKAGYRPLVECGFFTGSSGVTGYVQTGGSVFYQSAVSANASAYVKMLYIVNG